MFTPKQAAELTGIPASTVRRYRSEWSEFLSESSHKRRYTQDDIDTLRLIRDLIGQRKTKDEIADILLHGPPEPMTGDVFEDIPPEPQPQTAIQSIEFFSRVIDQLTDEHKIALAAKDQTIDILLTENERLRAELAKKDRGFWDRLFRRSE